MQLKMGVGSMEGGQLFGFSTKGARELAHVTPDGRLLIWDATLPKGGTPLEYVPSAHLASAPTCLAWNINPLKSSPKNNRRSSLGGSVDGDIVALGTSSGSILLYSTLKNNVVSTLQTKNEESILSLAWKTMEPVLFAGGQHGHLFIFNTSKSKLDSSHSYGTQPISALAVPPNEPNKLLIASSVISLICLDTQTVLKTLASHSGQIHILSILNTDLFLSASSQDNVLNVWSLSRMSKPYFTLSAKEGVTGVNSIQDEEKVLRIAVVTESGSLKVYGKELAEDSPSKKKPLKPISVVQIAANKDDQGKVKPFPVLSSQFNDMNEIRIAYGERTKPQFEVLKIDELEKDNCLTRSLIAEDGLKSSLENATGYTSNLQVPSSVNGVVAPSSGTNKRKATDNSSSTNNSESLTMIDRLKLLSKDYDPKTSPPRSDTLLQLLLQGLHNKDEKILSSVLDRTELSIIDNTVKKLPMEAIIPLIEELQKYLRGRGMVNQSHSNWLKSILLHHSTFIMSLPNCDQVLSALISMLEERTRNYPSLLMLQGKLNLITKQMSEQVDQSSASGEDNIRKMALMVHLQDSDSDLPNALDELLLPASDTDDNWVDEDDEVTEEKEEEEDDSSDEVELINGGDNDNEVEMVSDDDD